VGEVAGSVAVREFDAHAWRAYCVRSGTVAPDDTAINDVRLTALSDLEAECQHGSLTTRGVGLDEETAGTEGGGRFAARA
jgi:hypothetical protein